MYTLEVAEHQEQLVSESFCGSIKSFNSRRGFGFVSCAETAERFGRDVYLSKDEAVMLAVEPAVGQVAMPGNDESKTPPVQEGDFLLFQVKLSIEGFPQAVQVRRIRRLQGVVLQSPSTMSDGIIVVSGDCSDGAEGISVDERAAVQQLVGAEVRVREAECGQLQLLPNDMVTFCCANTTDTEGPTLEARLLDLTHTLRASGSLLGCFSLALPRPPSTDSKQSLNVQLPGYALTDRILLSDVPLDLGTSWLMRLFKKLGGLEASILPSNTGAAFGFASVSFSAPENVAKFLVQATHTISETGITQLAHVGRCLHKSGGCCHICSDTSTVSAVNDTASEASTDSMVNDCSFSSSESAMMAGAQSLQNTNRQSLCTSPEPMQFFCTNPEPMQGLSQLPWSSCAVVNGLTLPVPLLSTNQPMPVPQSVSISSPPSWRCVHGNIVVPTEEPAVVANGCNVRFQWPTVIHASAYVIELLDQGTMASQRYSHVAPEGPLPVVMDAQVDVLQPGMYGVCIRCIAPCGCESTCSPWSNVQLGCVQSSGVHALHMMPTNAPADMPSVQVLSCPPPPTAPPSLPLAATAAVLATLPPIPEEAGDIVGHCSDEILTLD